MSGSSESGPVGPVEMGITSDPLLFRPVREATENLALAIGFSPEVTGKIVLAMEEALTNVFKHGYAGVKGKPIHVRMDAIDDCGRKGIRIVIRDEAQKVDPAEIRGRELDDIRPGGLGVHLIRTIMSRVDYATHERGMALEMVKYLG